MRKGILVGFFSALLFVLLAAPASAVFNASVSISVFHDTLAPHGRWIVSRSYGEVWVPAGIDASWQPYWNGEWVWTDYGWTWVSYDPWGDIPYHYGTWTWVDGDGWAWIPGTVWAPAWVTWAWTDNCIGWAPVPASFAFSATGYFGSPVVLPASRYVFVNANQFVGTPVRSARLASTRNATLLASAQRATRFNVSGGVVRTTADPPPAFVQRASGRRLQTVSIARAGTHPTALSEAARGTHIGVVAPARERAAMTARNTTNAKTARTGSSSTSARVATARRTNERGAASASIRNGSKSSSHAPVRIERNSRTGSRTVTNARSAAETRATHKTRSSTTASGTRSASAHETARKTEVHASAPQAHASAQHPAPPAQAGPERAAHAAPEAHVAPHAAPARPPAARQAPPPPKQPKQHAPKPKDQDHS